MPLSKEQRDALPDEHFAVPAKRKLPINDATHTKLAWDMVDRTQGLTDPERAEARRNILRRAKELGVDTTAWEKSLKHEMVLTLEIAAMSLDVPVVDGHPNRMPFTGVLTFVDKPSDAPPGGSGGRLTILPRAVAEKALPSLLAMPIDFTPSFDGHDVTRKIGTITGADVVGDEIQIEGFFYAADFPQECARIKAEKEALGFSYEIKAQTQVEGDLLKIVDGVFTGAAVLRKDKAAYQSTSLAANAAEEFAMTKEELEALLKASLAPVTTKLEELAGDVTKLKASNTDLNANKETREKVAPHAQALRNCAAAMEAAGIGLHSDRGHVRVLHNMAASMEAEAASGRVPHIYRDHDWMFHSIDPNRQPAPQAVDSDVIKKAVEAAVTPLKAEIEKTNTTITDLKAKAFQDSPAPERRTLSGEGIALLSKAGLKLEDGGKIGVRALDASIEKAGLSRQDSIALKLSLSAAGALDNAA